MSATTARYVRAYTRMSVEELAQLQEAAHTYGMTLGEVARAALGDWLADHEAPLARQACKAAQ